VSRLSPDFKENVMARIEAHERMAALYRKAGAEGFTVRRDPDRRGVVFAMPKDLVVGLEHPDPRFGTVADLMEHEAEMFDFLEAGDRLIEAVLADGPEPRPVEGFLRPVPAAVAPVVRGGQGRTDDEVLADVRALLVVGLGGIVIGLALGAILLLTGHLPGAGPR
jgi:hypothetical protein